MLTEKGFPFLGKGTGGAHRSNSLAFKATVNVKEPDLFLPTSMVENFSPITGVFAMNVRFCCSLSGLASLLAMQLTLMAHLQSIPSDIPQNIHLWSMAGVLCGGYLFRSKKYAAPMALTLSITAIACISMAHLGIGSALWNMAYFYSGTLLPPLLQLLLRESSHPGLHLGIALGAADCFWNFLNVLPAPVSASVLVRLLVVLQVVAGVAFMLGHTEEGSNEEVLSPPLVLPREVLPLLCSLTGLFCFLNVLISLPVRAEEEGFVSKVLSLYMWILYPLTGRMLDRLGTNTRFMLLCLGATVLAALCEQLLQGSLSHWLAEFFTLAGRKGGFLFLLLLFSFTPRGAPSYGGVVALPFVGLLGMLWMSSNAEVSLSGGLFFILLIILLVLLLVHCCMRLQVFLSAIQDMQPKAEDMRCHIHVQRSSESFLAFAQKYNISVREQDVLRLIVAALDTTAIGLTLHLSEHTIKSHVRQLLRKTKTRNRITLAALFFNEMGGKTEGI